MRRFSSFEQWDELLMSLSHSPPAPSSSPPLLPCRNSVDPPARRRRSEPQWSAGARSSSRPTTLHLYPPFKKLYNCPPCQTDRPLHLVGRNPLRLRWFCPGFPLFSVPSKSEWTAKRSVGGVGVRYWWTSVQTSTSWRRALQRAPPTRPSGCIHRRVTYCRPPAAGRWPEGGDSGCRILIFPMNVFLSLDGSHSNDLISKRQNRKKNQRISHRRALTSWSVPSQQIVVICARAPRRQQTPQVRLSFGCFFVFFFLKRMELRHLAGFAFLLFFTVGGVWTVTQPGGLLSLFF